MSKKIISILIPVLVCFTIILSSCAINSSGKDESVLPGSEIKKNEIIEKSDGYVSVAVEDPSPVGGSFLTCGTKGRLDRIFADGTIENIPLDTGADLTQVLVGPDITLVSGYAGTLLYSKDGQNFSPCEGIDKTDILGLAFFDGKYYACTSGGSILESADGLSWRRNAKLGSEAIISMSAGGEYMMAVTTETDIHISSDGINWDSQNFNIVFNGYYDKFVFEKMECIGETLVILGYPLEYPDIPLVMYSDNGGELWMFYSLAEINDQEMQDFTPLRVNSVCMFDEEIMGACNKGRILALASCETCNLLMTTTNPDFRSITATGERMAVVGDDYAFAIFGVEDLIPDKISSEQALADFESGALIIDLRSEDEYIQSHIKGCLHIPFNALEGKLRELVPDTDTELIFYCSTGADAQKALETALQLGYHTVFNLGAISNWYYETE